MIISFIDVIDKKAFTERVKKQHQVSLHLT